MRTILSALVAGAFLVIGISIGEVAGSTSAQAATKPHPAMLMGFYSPPMCAEDGGTADGPVSYCTLKDGFVIKFGDFSKDGCAMDNGRVVKTAWGKFCALHSGYSIKIDMETSHAL
jgi:hypothetical protein